MARKEKRETNGKFLRGLDGASYKIPKTGGQENAAKKLRPKHWKKILVSGRRLP
jgi:hypothetical protein